MDILTSVFREAGLRRRLLDVRQLAADRALRFPCERSLGFHVVLEGVAWVHSSSLPTPLRLEAGDVAVMGRGCDHVLAPRATLGGMATETVGMAGATDGADAHHAVSVVSGAYQFWTTPVHPLFAELPEWFVVRAERTTRLEPLGLTVSMLAAEAQGDALGRDSVVHGLLDVLFMHLIRMIVAQRGRDGTACWSHAIGDPQVRRVVAAMHSECARPWTLDSLAREANLSRSVLAERFREAMGDTPLSYLRTVRLQHAMRLLTERDQTLEQVAMTVGYNDAFSFSKAFKRTVGLSPGEFRKRDEADRGVPWRFGSQDAPVTG
jgi:AraC-like DNA-binding protein